MNKLNIFLLIFLFATTGCKTAIENGLSASDLPIDKNATEETKALYYNLKEVAKEHVLYGHQDDLAYGYSWWAEPGRSDVKESTGSYPAVYGWELGGIGNPGAERSLDSVSFEKIKIWMREGYERGGINTISWHMDHPVTGGSTWDRTPAVSQILPGGSYHDRFNEMLDQFVAFIKDVKDSEGKLIPVIFRPYHEHTGSWFWWGDEQTSVEDYVALWRYTVEYLRDKNDVHNLLYAYSPDGQGGREFDRYMEKYPGDEYVDILGLDDYGSLNNRPNGAEGLSNELAWLVEKANEKNKVAALSETGQEALPDSTWFTGRLLKSFQANPKAKGIAYALTWRNANYEKEQRDHFYAAHPGHPSAADMKAFRDSELVLFEDELPDMYSLPKK